MASRAESIELILIALCVVLSVPASKYLPHEMSHGGLIITCSAIILFQSLVRDVGYILRKSNAADSEKMKRGRYMCVESTLGLFGVLIGGALFYFELGDRFPTPPFLWIALVCVSLFAGYQIKDLVFSVSPFRLFREKDHRNIIVGFGRGDAR